MTLLEVLLALAILAGATTVGIGGMGAVQRMGQVEQDRLNAMEVAHRLLLNHMIDPESLPDTARPIAQGRGVYRYEIDEAVLEEQQEGSGTTRRSSRPMSETTGNQRLQAGLVMATVRVYRDAGGVPDTRRGVMAELSRIYDPFETDEESIMFNQLKALLGVDAPRPNR